MSKQQKPTLNLYARCLVPLLLQSLPQVALKRVGGGVLNTFSDFIWNTKGIYTVEFQTKQLKPNRCFRNPFSNSICWDSGCLCLRCDTLLQWLRGSWKSTLAFTSVHKRSKERCSHQATSDLQRDYGLHQLCNWHTTQQSHTSSGGLKGLRLLTLSVSKFECSVKC